MIFFFFFYLEEFVLITENSRTLGRFYAGVIFMTLILGYYFQHPGVLSEYNVFRGSRPYTARMFFWVHHPPITLGQTLG